MAKGVQLRQIAVPVVAAAPTGVRVRTRLHVSEAEATALTAIGVFLGSVYRGELAGRIGCGVLDRQGRAVWRAERKQAITAVSSSRWAGAITRAVEDQFQLGMRGLAAQVADLRAAVQVVEARCALRPGELAPVDPDDAACVADLGGSGVIAAGLSGSPRPAGWQCCADGWPRSRRRWRRGVRRWWWVGNGCGAPVITSTRRT